MTFAPLQLKYRTKSDRRYCYDASTGRIIRVDPVLYAILDDYRVLSDAEIVRKYEHLGKRHVLTALDELAELRGAGYLRDHLPTELSRVDRVQYEGKLRHLEKFWMSAAMLLILGVTEKCNLRCEYCCYNGRYPGQRSHGRRTMSGEIAERAITYFIENEQAGDDTCPITFYGGEPLLELGFVERCVDFAVNRAESLGKTARFAVTTNGTLLDDAVADYLVKHDFLVLVSLDGPRAAHDRYRRYPDGTGSFEIVERNLRRFVERYPDYGNRGLSVTLTPPFDLEATSTFIETLCADYPLTRINLVNSGNEEQNDGSIPTRYGCHSASACKKNLDVVPFRSFDKDNFRKLESLWRRCMKSIAKEGLAKTRESMPFATLLFESQITLYHRRAVMDEAPEHAIYVPCLPGFNRRFCDVDGNYRVCERTDHSKSYIVGDVWNGPDPQKMHRVMERRRQLGDCGNCPSLRTCDLCYARIPGPENGDDSTFEIQCRKTRGTTLQMLQTYTEIMERNPKAFDGSANENTSRFKTILYGVSNEAACPQTGGT